MVKIQILMKYLIAIAFLALFACESQPSATKDKVSPKVEVINVHPDSMDVCCGQKCVTVSWATYKHLNLANGDMACGYVNDKLKD